MARVKYKIAKSKSNDNGAKIMNLFNMMSGTEDANPTVIIPKICKVRNKVRHILKVLNQFATAKFVIMPFEKHSDKFKQILDFCETCKKDLCFQNDTEDTETEYKKLSKDKVNIIYRGIKNSETVQQIMILTAILKKFKIPLESYDKSKENFINTEPGSKLFLFRFSDLDFKVLWADPNMDSQLKMYIATVLKLLYQDGEAIYDIITSADIDPDEFASVMSQALSQMENNKEIASCRDAFRTIRESTNMLKEKMNDYYRASVISENPSLMFTNFLSDVINNKLSGPEGKNNDKLRAQFMRICGFIQKQSQKRGVNDPIMNKMMNNVKTIYKASKNKSIDVKKSIITQMTGLNINGNSIDLGLSGLSAPVGLAESSTEEKKIPRNANPSSSTGSADSAGSADSDSELVDPELEEMPEMVLDESDEELLKELDERDDQNEQDGNISTLKEIPLTSLDISTKDN